MATMATTIATESEIGREEMISDSKIEQLLSEKLMDGYVLMEATCPKCAVPLVKNHQMVPRSLSNLSSDENDPTKTSLVDRAILLPMESFEQPFKPVDGVPMCVACDSHVITQETEIAILEQCDTLKDKGSIYVALETAYDPEPEPKVDNSIQDVDRPEIINLEHIAEDDFIVGSHRRKFIVDIETTSFDMDGVSHVEMTMSPKIGDSAKPIDVEEMAKKDEVEHSVRREIATKVLGAKMLQGWTLKEETCGNCAMPLMENKGKAQCPVCPALAKRAKKKNKIEAEKDRLAREIMAKKLLVQQTEQLEHIQSVRGEVKVRAFKEDEEATQRADDRKRAIEEEKTRILALEQEQNGAQQIEQTFEKEEENASPEIQERARVLIEEERNELERLEAIAKEEEQRRNMTVEERGKESQQASVRAKRKAEREAAAEELAKEAKAIEAFDEATMADDKTEAMKKDQMVDEHRKRMAGKLTLDEQIAKLEEDRVAEAMEARRIAEERRVEGESRMIAALEADAAMKALAAEDAIRRAKDALREVSDTKRHIIIQTIELAEMEAVAETEESIKATFEDYNEPVILQTASEICTERWETLRLEGRAIMTRRVLKGWAITPEACLGIECHNSPLIEKHGVKECAVCGGCGKGTDGVYETTEEEEEAPIMTPAPLSPSVANDVPEDWLGNGKEEEFEKKRDIYAKEIGKRMLEGWKLVDSSCPTCIMPLMMDDKGNTDICIACGEVKQQFDASTIATKDMATLEIVEEGAEQHDRALSPVVESLKITPSDESGLVSSIQKEAPKQQTKINLVVRSDPPAFKRVMRGEVSNDIFENEIIHFPPNIDFADADAIRELIGVEEQGRDDHTTKDASVDTVANLFLKSPHGYDFQDFGKSMGIDEVKELVEIFLVTNVDKDVSDGFKFDVAKRILSKMNLPKGREASSPPRMETTKYRPPPDRFIFDDTDHLLTTKERVKPCPENGQQTMKRPPRSPGYRQFSPVNLVSSPRMQSPRDRDDMSIASRASSVASDALQSIYDRIDQCRLKLLDPNNNLDEQIATASLLEKLAQAAVAMKEMEYLE